MLTTPPSRPLSLNHPWQGLLKDWKGDIGSISLKGPYVTLFSIFLNHYNLYSHQLNNKNTHALILLFTTIFGHWNLTECWANRFKFEWNACKNL